MSGPGGAGTRAPQANSGDGGRNAPLTIVPDMEAFVRRVSLSGEEVMPQDPVVRPPFVRVADLAEIRPGTAKLVVGPFDKPMALFNVEGEIFAINAVCPHRGGPLAEGTLTGSVVACPWHGWTFDVRSGHPDHPGGHSVAAYHVRVDAGAVYVGWLKR